MAQTVITAEDITASVANALQFIAVHHPADFIRHLARAYAAEESLPARSAMAQILINARMSALGRRPMCQDTGLVNVFLKIGMDVRLDTARSLPELVNEGVRRAWRDNANPLRASMVVDPLFARRNSGDNTPAVIHVDVVPGNTLEITVAAKGGGSENKARFAALNPRGSVVDWVVQTVEGLGAGWCPPGMLGIGVGGSAEKAMQMAKESLMEPLDMFELLARGPASPEEAMRIEIYQKVNALGIGAQGLGGLTTVLDVKLKTFPTHAASLPVGLIPNCAATRHVSVTLDGTGPAGPEPPDLADWPEVALQGAAHLARRVDLDTLSREEVASWRAGETLLLNGRLLTGRDAAHHRLAGLLAKGEPSPVNFAGRALYYVGPVEAVGQEVIGPAGPTTATRLDGFTDMMLGQLGLLVMIGKAERGPETVASIKHHGAAYLVAVGGAAFLISKAIRAARVLAFDDLGMEAIHEFLVVDMPVTVAVDATGTSVHAVGPALWRR
jgi:fumarate hydratase, class I